MLLGMGENSGIRPVHGMRLADPSGAEGEVVFIDFETVVVLMDSGCRVTEDRAVVAATWKAA